MTGALPTVAFVPDAATRTAAWLQACQAQMGGEAGTVAWREVAEAWAATARACPEGAAADRAIYWTLAGRAAERARGTT